jgi:hypothetical protein
MMVCIGDGSTAARTACATPPENSVGIFNVTLAAKGAGDIAWIPAAVNEQKGTSGQNSVTAMMNATAIGKSTVMALRYGWPQDDSTCCPQTDVVNGLSPCIPGR